MDKPDYMIPPSPAEVEGYLESYEQQAREQGVGLETWHRGPWAYRLIQEIESDYESGYMEKNNALNRLFALREFDDDAAADAIYRITHSV